MNDLLAMKLRPNTLEEVIGQEHLIGKDKVLYNLIKNKKLFSMILYGKPGIGKTTIALMIVNELGLRYKVLNAVINNKKDFDIAVEEAKMNHGLILIMDEIHRLNKDKQDLLLPFLESGLITLIGMTTSNPYHAINPAIRSRCQLYELKELSDNDIKKGIKRLIDKNVLEGLTLNEEAIDYIIKVSSSDLRFAYNLIEVAYYASSDKNIDINLLKNICNKPNIFHDKNEDGYYDVISALQKSIRGSDVNASLHYLARLINAGDLDIIIRRLSVIAYEDIGLANPSIGPKLDAVINAVLRLGLPEASIPLASIVIEMALSPKSNSAVLAINNALNDVISAHCGNVPEHIKTTSPNYKYPHDYPNHFVKQEYLPENIRNRKYYNPQNNINELKYKEVLKKIEDLRK
ncbi:MAG: replication-associated recombination protein A [Tenericutes bacterium]|nr:replication-associated recombination protein A [Mycoplasmatota bacterium]